MILLPTCGLTGFADSIVLGIILAGIGSVLASTESLVEANLGIWQI